MLEDLPIFAICGWRGSGKTTLIEGLVRQLRGKGLKVAVVKHDVHGIDVDRRSKDSDRLYRAGADVLLQGQGEEFLRFHAQDHDGEWTRALPAIAERHDIVLVEGRKSTPLPKVWLLGEQQAAPAGQTDRVQAVLPWDSDRLGTTMGILEGFLARQWLKTPVFGCVLIGGKSTRMGTPKHLLKHKGATWLERTVGLLGRFSQRVIVAGAGAVPRRLAHNARLPDVPDVGGPMAGVLAAMRWAPRASWLMAACDLPHLSGDALEWLLSSRAPGVWATLPRLEGSPGVEPLLGHYDFRARLLLEEAAERGDYRLQAVAFHPKTISPIVPSHLAAAWKNTNAPGDREPDAPQVQQPGQTS